MPEITFDERGKIPIMYNVETRQVGCAILQGAYGCNPALSSLYFNTESWQLAPSEGLKKYEVTKEQLQFLADKTNKHWEEKGKTQ